MLSIRLQEGYVNTTMIKTLKITQLSFQIHKICKRIVREAPFISEEIVQLLGCDCPKSNCQGIEWHQPQQNVYWLNEIRLGSLANQRYEEFL